LICLDDIIVPVLLHFMLDNLHTDEVCKMLQSLKQIVWMMYLYI